MSLGQAAREGGAAHKALQPGDLPVLSTGDSLPAACSAMGSADGLRITWDWSYSMRGILAPRLLASFYRVR